MSFGDRQPGGRPSWDLFLEGGFEWYVWLEVLEDVF